MAELAQAAVFAPTTMSGSSSTSRASSVHHEAHAEHHPNEGDEALHKDSALSVLAHKVVVCGPAGEFDSVPSVLGHYAHMGFQASNYGQAVRMARDMLRRQRPSRQYVVQGDAFVEVKDEAHTHEREDESTWVYPALFMGITANLLGTGCREAVRFVVKHGIQPRSDGEATLHESHLATFAAQEDWSTYSNGEEGKEEDEFASLPQYKSFLTALVVSGGGVEHDIRRACSDYVLDRYVGDAVMAKKRMKPYDDDEEEAKADMARFGNVCYEDHNKRKPGTQQADGLFDMVMQALAMRLCARQERRKAKAAAPAASGTTGSACEVCSWAITPSEVWYCAGRWLVQLMTEALGHLRRNEGRTRSECHAEAVQRARGTVVYWAARQQVPLFCPSFADGDIMRYILPRTGPPTAVPACGRLQLDLVGDIHALNKCAMLSKCSAMLIAGGGVVKHHVCNANLMRNGADYAIFMNNGMEFDGSDAGARPDEAVSWGKIRIDGQSVKIYSEVTAVLPLLIAEVFVPAVRDCMQGQQQQQQQQQTQ